MQNTHLTTLPRTGREKIPPRPLQKKNQQNSCKHECWRSDPALCLIFDQDWRLCAHTHILLTDSHIHVRRFLENTLETPLKSSQSPDLTLSSIYVQPWGFLPSHWLRPWVFPGLVFLQLTILFNLTVGNESQMHTQNRKCGYIENS